MILQEKRIYSLVSKMILFLEKKGSRKYWFLVYSIIYEIQFTLSAPGHLHEIQCPCSLCKVFVKQKISIYFNHLNPTLNISFLFFCLI